MKNGKNNNGWIKLHRSIEEHEFYFAEKFTKLSAWIDLLILANHKPQTVFIRGIEIKLNTGELAYSVLSLSKRWRWNRRTVHKFLLTLSKKEMIYTRIDNLTTFISITNYEYYQNNAHQSAHQSNTRMHTDKNVKNVKNNTNTIGASENVPVESQNEKQGKDESVPLSLFAFWNEKKIVSHKVAAKFLPALHGVLEHYTEEEIMAAMDNYAKVLHGKKYFWSYRWSLDQFLQRKNGLDKFLPENFNEVDYYCKEYREVLENAGSKKTSDRLI